MDSVKMRDDCDMKTFIEALLRNGYWVKIEEPKSVKERIAEFVIVYFEKESED
ncbi:hypothetical protein [Anaerotignum sp.]